MLSKRDFKPPSLSRLFLTTLESTAVKNCTNFFSLFLKVSKERFKEFPCVCCAETVVLMAISQDLQDSKRINISRARFLQVAEEKHGLAENKIVVMHIYRWCLKRFR